MRSVAENGITMDEALTRAEPVDIAKQSLSVDEVVARARKVQEIQQAVMLQGTHYGQIPGTPKPSLWQPGAEKLLMTFQLAPDLEMEDLSTADAIRYRVTARIRHVPSGEYVGIGVGEASSDEEKYRWRRAVCDEEWGETLEDRRRKKWAKKKNGDTYTIHQIRTVPADIANTVLKMAKKRALVDGAKSTCAASDIFDQDIEDLKRVGVDVANGQPAETVAEPRATAPPPQSKSNESTAKANDTPSSGRLFDITAGIPDEAWAEVHEAWHESGTISDKQAARLFAIAGNNGWKGNDIAKIIEHRLSVDIADLPWGDVYSKVVSIFESFQPEA